MRYLLLCLLAIATPLAAGPIETDTDARIVAVGDVHGALDEFTTLLREVELIDANGNWSGGNTHLVSLGDLVDRGPGSREVVELMMKLERQAAAAGGAVHTILGNHEVMVMTGDLRYVSRPEFAAFANDETPAEREALFQGWLAAQSGLDEAAARATFEDKYPPGFVGLQKAYASDGSLGRWLKTLPLAIRVNDRLYIHAGASSAIVEQPLAEINQSNQDDLLKYMALVEKFQDQGLLARHVDFWNRRAYLNAQAEAVLATDPKARPPWFEDFLALMELEDAFLFTPDSPIWYRGTAYCHPYAESFNTERLLKRTGTKQLVIGHTPYPRGAISRLDGQVLRLDTGMLASVYKGIPSALVIEGEESWLHYVGGESRAQPLVFNRSISQQLWKLSDEQLEDILRSGRIVNNEDIGTGVTKPKRLTIREGDFEGYAVFKYEDTDPGMETRERYRSRQYNNSDRYQYDPAAYHLDRMIDLQMVPVSVIRTVEGQEGTVGAWIPNAINERDRAEQEIPFNSHCAKDEQYRLRFIFDVLVYNEDRNLTNIMWTKKDFMLRFIDHSLAFRTTERRPKQYRKIELRVSDLTARKLQSLDEATLKAELGEWLHPRQIEAIVARRDLILKEAIRTDP